MKTEIQLCLVSYSHPLDGVSIHISSVLCWSQYPYLKYSKDRVSIHLSSSQGLEYERI